MSGSARVWLFTLVLAAIALVAAVPIVSLAPPAQLAFTIPGWILAAGFFLAEAKVIHLHIGRSAHSFSLSELPVVAGLFLVAPWVFIVARLIGSGLGLFIGRRQRSVKLVFNLAQFGLCSVTSVAIVHLAAPADGSFGPGLSIAVLFAALIENLIGVLCVSTAISLAEGTAQYRRIPEMLKIGVMVSVTNSSIGLMGLVVLVASPQSAWLFVVPTVTAALAYRAYISERQQHESIELLFESTRILQRSPQLDTAVTALLGHARKMFRADVAEIHLLPRRTGDDILRCQVGPGDKVEVMQSAGPTLKDPTLLVAVAERQARLLDRPGAIGDDGAVPPGDRSALVAPLLGESNIIGTLMVSDPVSDISSFDLEDLKLFETLANHIAIALENGQLEQSLEQLGRLKEELHHQASHDSLTGLANRSLFSQFVASRLEARDRSGLLPVVLFIDLDDFKLVNDSLGHAAGDALLMAVGDRLQTALRAGDIAARLGGDEFAVLLRDKPDMRAALRVAKRLVTVMSPFFQIEGHDVNVRASIGVAAGRPGVDTAGDLLRNADVAMYSAKARGKGRVVVFESAMHEEVMARAQLSADLERAIAVREFGLLYQPIVEIATGRIMGVEALVRWNHPDRGKIGPDDFIRVAEESDAILGIGRWVLREACLQIRGWHDLIADRPFTVSVNISARQLMQPDFVREVLAIIGAAQVDPERVVLEMTETSMLQDSAATRSKLQELRDAGIGVSIDDFGTGYSSLSYLQRFPVTALKIARDFVVMDNVLDPDAWELASAIIALGRTLKLSVIAEGVEQQAQLARLRKLGCEYAQGFYLARPLEPWSVQSFLAHGVVLTGDPLSDGVLPAETAPVRAA
ncbi:MAG: putative bifunctional diguanylate cyclase/phosphodiesterase [Aeromicrobium sp.]